MLTNFFKSLKVKTEIYEKYLNEYVALVQCPNIKIKMRDLFGSGIIVSSCEGLQESIDVLVGIKVKLTKIELLNKELKNLHSYITQDNCILLGPARHLNHSCQPNISPKIDTKGRVSFTIVSTSSISIGDELVFKYASYHANNDECTCDKVFKQLSLKSWK